MGLTLPFDQLPSRQPGGGCSDSAVGTLDVHHAFALPQFAERPNKTAAVQALQVAVARAEVNRELRRQRLAAAERDYRERQK